jgi:hypothetical protein
MITNSSGKIMYGMHFYPGIAGYNEPKKGDFKIFLNEDVLRKMDSSFAGKPIFVEHVDEVDPNIDQLRKEADGWVVESFFNAADGKHWCKMVIVSERAERAIKNGYKLSNAYIPQLNGKSGVWNGIDYQNEVVDGEYEHLAIVQNPRYAESIIMTPEEFKSYNENLKIELSRISNSQPKEKSMLSKMKFWNRKPVENSIDLENVSVTLPKSGKEFSIFQIVNAMDEMEMKKKENKKENKEEDVEEELEEKKKKVDVEGDLHNEEGAEDEEVEAEKEEKKKELKNKKMKNKKEEMEDCYNEDEEEDKKAKKKLKELEEHEEEEIKEEEVKKNKKMKNENFYKLKNAHEIVHKVENDDFHDQISRGKAKYGSK